ILGMASRQEALRVEVGRAAELPDALGDLIGVPLLLLRVLLELLRHALAVDPRGHEVVAPIPERADDLGGQRLVEQLERRGQVGPVVGRDRPLLYVLSGSAPDLLDVAEERLLFHGRSPSADRGGDTMQWCPPLAATGT